MGRFDVQRFSIKKLLPLMILMLLAAGCQGRLGYVEIEGAIVESKEICDDLKKFEEDSNIKGVLIEVNSPGGGVGASQEIADGIKRLTQADKKVVVYMSAVAASGGYYVSLPADTIVALPSTLTGSIGVILTFPVYKDLLDKVGVQMYAVKSRDRKDIGSGFRYPEEEDTLLLKSMIDDIYQQFLEEVVEYRGLPYDSVYTLADGRILSGRQAHQCGLVDVLGTKQDAHRILAEMCGLEGTPKLKEIPKERSFWEEFIESRLGVLFGPSVRYELLMGR